MVCNDADNLGGHLDVGEPHGDDVPSQLPKNAISVGLLVAKWWKPKRRGSLAAPESGTNHVFTRLGTPEVPPVVFQGPALVHASALRIPPVGSEMAGDAQRSVLDLVLRIFLQQVLAAGVRRRLDIRALEMCHPILSYLRRRAFLVDWDCRIAITDAQVT